MNQSAMSPGPFDFLAPLISTGGYHRSRPSGRKINQINNPIGQKRNTSSATKQPDLFRRSASAYAQMSDPTKTIVIVRKKRTGIYAPSSFIEFRLIAIRK
jgi:hypothetical protein